MILIVVKMPVRPDREEEWAALAADYARAVNAEEGSLFFEWSRSVEEPGTWVCIEGFRDADAGAAHVGTQAFADFVGKAPDLVAAQPQIIYVDAADVAGWDRWARSGRAADQGSNSRSGATSMSRSSGRSRSRSRGSTSSSTSSSCS